MIARRAAAAAVVLLLAPLARAAVPAWVDNPCAGIDCAATYAGVGRADFLPEMRISSAIAYARAARNLSSMISDRMLVDHDFYQEDGGQAGRTALQSVASSPLGAAMTKIYGDGDSDLIRTAVELKPLADPGLLVYAEEYVDVSSRTLYVRLAMSRSDKPFAPAPGAVRWTGRDVRVSYQDLRSGPKTELTMWVEDRDNGLTWEEYWPTGGAELVRDGKASSSYAFDRSREAWAELPAALPKKD